MGREHRIVFALADTEVPVPPVHGHCDDVEVNGAPFYLMRYVEGLVPHDATTVAGVPDEERRALGHHVVQVLATLHGIEPEDVGLGDLGRREAYLARQLRRWSKQWAATQTHEIPEMEESERLLREQHAGAGRRIDRARRLPAWQHDRGRWPHSGGTRLGALHAG